MFPNIRQRVLIFLGCLVAGLICLALIPWPQPLYGLSLLSSNHIGGLIVGFIAAWAVCTLSGILIGSAGNPLAGLFTYGIAMSFAPAGGGTMQAWLWNRTATHPDAGLSGTAVLLIAELLIWMLAAWLAWMIIVHARLRLRERLPGWLRNPWIGDAVDMQEIDHAPSLAEAMLESLVKSFTHSEKTLRFILLAGVMAVAGFALTWLMMRDPSMKQVIGAILLSFLLAALAADQLFAQSRRVTAGMIGVLIVAVAWYLSLPVRFDGFEMMLLGSYEQPIGLAGAWALPSVFGTSAVAGLAAGFGWSQVIHQARLVANQSTSPQNDAPQSAA